MIILMMKKSANEVTNAKIEMLTVPMACAMKLIFSPESGRILGAQAVGTEGIDKRIDILATAIQAGWTVYDLEELELCYSPQFGSAKDPVNMAGFIAAGVLRGDQPICHAESLVPSDADNTSETAPTSFLLDVRTPNEYASGSIAGAVNIPVDELRERLHEIPKDRPIVAFCKVGMRGYLATCILAHHGYEVRNLSGGYTTYSHVAASSG